MRLERLHSEELYDLHCSPNTFRVKNTRRIGCTVLEDLMGKERDTYRNWMGKPGRKNTLISIVRCNCSVLRKIWLTKLNKSVVYAIVCLTDMESVYLNPKHFEIYFYTNHPIGVANAWSINIQLTCESLIYIATSFDPKLGTSSGHNERNWKFYRN
jgi:hypothetical protein